MVVLLFHLNFLSQESFCVSKAHKGLTASLSPMTPDLLSAHLDL